ncbi:MAG: winged helix DNA-binding protein [Bifidobacteriaceae bacterium]|jgi:DNA-binding MarR family transcriptional regulator|nr:winged helix DNA-binding protein [Bifidobacteriaceae bacterium]
MTENTNERALVAGQLLRLHELLGRHERRAMAEQRPWGDPRKGQGRVLALLKIKPEISQRELTYLLDMSRQASAELLAKLERQGLIERTTSARDRRAVIVKLTEAGQAAQQGGDGEVLDIEDSLDGLSPAELTSFADALAKVIDRLERLANEAFEDQREALAAFWQRNGRDGAGEFGPFGPFDPRFGGRRPGPRGRWRRFFMARARDQRFDWDG